MPITNNNVFGLRLQQTNQLAIQLVNGVIQESRYPNVVEILRTTKDAEAWKPKNALEIVLTTDVESKSRFRVHKIGRVKGALGDISTKHEKQLIQGTVKLFSWVTQLIKKAQDDSTTPVDRKKQRIYPIYHIDDTRAAGTCIAHGVSRGKVYYYTSDEYLPTNEVVMMRTADHRLVVGIVVGAEVSTAEAKKISTARNIKAWSEVLGVVTPCNVLESTIAYAHFERGE